MASKPRSRVPRVPVVIAIAALLVGLLPAAAAARDDNGGGHRPDDGAVFFVSDGMRQDLVAKYAAQGPLPTMADFLKKGTSAAGTGLTTGAPATPGGHTVSRPGVVPCPLAAPWQQWRCS